MDNKVVEIPNENILMNFYIEDQEYVVLSDTEDPDEGDSIYFAKRDSFEDQFSIIRSIENDDEYEKVIAKYESLIKLMEDENEESNN